MSQDQHSPEQAPGEPLYGSESASDPRAGVSRRSEALSGPQTGAESFSRFDSDPEALAWARAKVQAYIDQLADWARQASEREASAKAQGIAVSRLLAERRLIGGRGCTIGAFDERLPAYRAALRPAHDGPSIAEAKADDRAHWDQKYAGEGT